MASIDRVTGFEILDSRGNPTVAAEVVLADGAHGFAPDLPSIGTLTGYAGQSAFAVYRNITGLSACKRSGART